MPRGVWTTPVNVAVLIVVATLLVLLISGWHERRDTQEVTAVPTPGPGVVGVVGFAHTIPYAPSVPYLDSVGPGPYV